MAVQKQDDQHEHTFRNYVRIQDVVLKTCLRRWTIGKSGERGSGISVLPAQHDDEDDEYIVHLRSCWALNCSIVTYVCYFSDNRQMVKKNTKIQITFYLPFYYFWGRGTTWRKKNFANVLLCHTIMSEVELWSRYHVHFRTNHHHHHHVVPPARISLTLSRHFSLSFIASGRSSGLHPVSSHSCCM